MCPCHSHIAVILMLHSKLLCNNTWIILNAFLFTNNFVLFVTACSSLGLFKVFYDLLLRFSIVEQLHVFKNLFQKPYFFIAVKLWLRNKTDSWLHYFFPYCILALLANPYGCTFNLCAWVIPLTSVIYLNTSTTYLSEVPTQYIDILLCSLC